MKCRGTLLAIMTLTLAGGCAHHNDEEQAREDMLLLMPPTPVTDESADKAAADYWMTKPPVASASSPEFQKLWDACKDTARSMQFQIDLENYRDGVLTTQPMVSRQFYEFWRSDVGNTYGLLQSSLGTVRRRIVFEVKQEDSGDYVAQPKVLVERLAQTPTRVTSVQNFRNGVAPAGNIITDQGKVIPAVYWYAIARDEALEKRIARDVTSRLQ